MPAKSPMAVLWVTSFGLLLLLVNNTSVNVALPELSAEFGAEAGLADWFLVAFMLANTASILVFGRISDLVGRRKVYLTGLVAFMLASLLAALAPSAGFFIAVRVVQGVAAATIVSNTTAIVADAFPPERLAIALSYNLTAASVGNTIGPAVGGLLVSAFGWQSVFLVNIPFGVVAVVLGHRIIPRTTSTGPRERFDLPGAVLSVVTLALLLYGLNRFGVGGALDPAFLVAITAGVALLVLFVTVERRVSSPLVDVELLRDRRRAIAYAAAFFNSFARAGFTVLVVLHQQVVEGRSAAEAGLVATAMAVAMVVASPLAGRLAQVLTWRTVSTAGGTLMALGGVGLTATVGNAPLGTTVTCLVLVGLGVGLFTGPNTAAVMWGVPANRRTVANAVRSMLYNTAQATSTSVMLIIVATSGLATYAVQSADPAVIRAFALAYGAAVVAAVVATGCAVSRGGPWLRRHVPVTEPAADRLPDRTQDATAARPAGSA
ncbi:MFS transporter [Nocardioides sp. BSK12Z-4]|uniref:MFS transporter n=1 Tax=Nocardioides bruguierae TaxID=2945102 RepID=A0A9X2D867_9ACTN|nr:MFS transporter [Nocardioides bruguierae]